MIIYDISADGTYAEVVGYDGTATTIYIADEYNGLPVKNIYKAAFINNRTIVAVVIPNSIISIGEDAFCNCVALEIVITGEGLASIGDYAFSRSSRLKTVILSHNITSIGAYRWKA